MERRRFLQVVGASGVVLGGAGWYHFATRRAPIAIGPYGPLLAPDGNGLALPPGFGSRVVAASSKAVADTRHRWHPAPDGGACFPVADGWVYVSNSEMDGGGGGVGAIRFAADGRILDAYPILTGSTRNCAGGTTPWGSWLSCEETERGYVWETFPLGDRAAVRRPALGRFKHEAAAVDPTRRHVYLTEDEPDGCLYRFTPDPWPSLTQGTLAVLGIRDEQGAKDEQAPIRWSEVPDPSAQVRATRRQVETATHFDGGEGCVYGDGTLWFTTKGDGRIWRLDTVRDVLRIAYDEGSRTRSAPAQGLDNLALGTSGDVFVAEDSGGGEICLLDPAGVASVFVRLVGHRSPELTGPAFAPDGTRMYFSSQRGRSGSTGAGVTFEVSGPFRPRSLALPTA